MICKLTIETKTCDEFIDISAQVQNAVAGCGLREGVCTVYVPHTTSAITIQENADPDVARDILVALKRICPDKEEGDYRHIEQNAPAHVKASLVGTSVSIPVEAGKLLLGTWQAIFFCEFDGPRRRQVIVQVS